MSVKELVATDIGSFVSALVEASRQFENKQPWWRGQQDVSWKLQPGLYRHQAMSKEININARFRLKAKSRRNDVPSNTDPLGWLFLMQHYRLPTRLLDWSQSPLVALYFALEKHCENDAVVWAFSPTGLNTLEAKVSSICTPGSQTIGQLGIQAFKDTGQKDIRILSVLTEEADIRHMVQQSAFTIHGRDEPLEDRANANKFMLKIRIPSTAKETLRQTIALLGVSRSSLFPDLENLALELASLNF